MKLMMGIMNYFQINLIEDDCSSQIVEYCNRLLVNYPGSNEYKHTIIYFFLKKIFIGTPEKFHFWRNLFSTKRL
jgi:hypothetical protein